MSRWRDLPFAVWVLIGFVVSFVAIGGGVLLARSGDDDGRGEAVDAPIGSTTTTAGPTTTSTTAPPSTTTTTRPPAATSSTTEPPAEAAVGPLTVGEPRGFAWPDPDHPPFPFPAPAEVRGGVDEGGRGDDEGDGAERYAFTIEIEERDATVEDVVAHLERFPAAAGWTATGAGGSDGDGAAAAFTFERDCGSGCRVEVRLDVLEPERRNRGPSLDVVVTFDRG